MSWGDAGVLSSSPIVAWDLAMVLDPTSEHPIIALSLRSAAQGWIDVGPGGEVGPGDACRIYCAMGQAPANETGLPGGPLGIAADEEILYFVSGEGIVPLRFDRGPPRWMFEETFSGCAAPALADGALTIACAEVGGGGAQLLRVETGSGEIVWRRTLPVVAQDRAQPASDPLGLTPGTTATPLGLSLAGEITILSFVQHPGGTTGEADVFVVAAFNAEGREIWSEATTPDPTLIMGLAGAPLVPSARPMTTTPISDGSVVVIKSADTLVGLDLRTGTRRWASPMGEDDRRRDHAGGPFGARSSALVATSTDSLYRFDWDGRPAWERAYQLPEGETFAPSSIVVGDDLVVTLTRAAPVAAAGGGAIEERASLVAITLETGDLAWRFGLPPRTLSFDPHAPSSAWTIAAAPGVILARALDGETFLLGDAPFAMALDPAFSTREPGLREPVRVDLSGARAGPGGPPDRYRVLWGDGEGSAWQSSPTFVHTYKQLGDFTARFEAANAANESTSMTQVFAVVPPSANPTTTWTWWLFAAALAISGAGGAFVLARRRPPPAPPRPGELFLGKYAVEREIGRGAFGAVWLARQHALAREVVIKQLHASHDASPRVAERFLREARLLAQLDHPHVTRIYDAELVAGRVYIVMEHAAGGSLADRLSAGSFPREAAVRVVGQALEGLAFLHARGVVHRDIKPANILLSAQGDVRIADLGVASAKGDLTVTRTGDPSPGSPLYMAPERFEGRAADARSDVYAFGLVAHEILARRSVYIPPPRDLTELQMRIADAPKIDEQLGPELARWMSRMLARDPAERFQTADEARAAFIRAASDPGTTRG